jgi:23S rRNA (pseudouridine1915-N3)-methyltransferase
MKIELWILGDPHPNYVKEAMETYSKRINKYISFGTKTFKNIKNAQNWPVELLKSKEWESIEKTLSPQDYLIVLDEKGTQMNSMQFSEFLNKTLTHVSSRTVFLIGGAYGFDNKAYLRAQQKISLSNLTFSHQLARIVLLEQIYRGFSILNNEPYHNE